MIWSNKLIWESSWSLLCNQHSATCWLIFWDSTLHFLSRLSKKNARILNFLFQSKTKETFFPITSTCRIRKVILVVTYSYSIKMTTKIFVRHIKKPIISLCNAELFSEVRCPKFRLIRPISCPFKLTPWVSNFE